MPIYEYACQGCGSQFEAIVRSSDTPQCPECSSEELEKLLSVFAVGSAAPDPKLGPCGNACKDPRGPGACGLN